jgi:hypothetical protein
MRSNGQERVENASSHQLDLLGITEVFRGPIFLHISSLCGASESAFPDPVHLAELTSVEARQRQGRHNSAPLG